jgi:hypothetical protein
MVEFPAGIHSEMIALLLVTSNQIQSGGTIYHLPFTIYHSPFTISNLYSIISNLSSILSTLLKQQSPLRGFCYFNVLFTSFIS